MSIFVSQLLLAILEYNLGKLLDKFYGAQIASANQETKI